MTTIIYKDLVFLLLVLFIFFSLLKSVFKILKYIFEILNKHTSILRYSVKKVDYSLKVIFICAVLSNIIFYICDIIEYNSIIDSVIVGIVIYFFTSHFPQVKKELKYNKILKSDIDSIINGSVNLIRTILQEESIKYFDKDCLKSNINIKTPVSFHEYCKNINPHLIDNYWGDNIDWVTWAGITIDNLVKDIDNIVKLHYTTAEPETIKTLLSFKSSCLNTSIYFIYKNNYGYSKKKDLTFDSRNLFYLIKNYIEILAIYDKLDD